MNVADSERMAGELAPLGYEGTEEQEEADLIIINTCCVRETAEDKIYGKIGELKQLKARNPKLVIGVTGCMAQKEGEKLRKRAPHVDFVLGTGQLKNLAATVEQIANRRRHSVVNTDMEQGTDSFRGKAVRQGKVSAWIPIMYGCDNFCTYCIVPYVRGRERSRTMEEILAEAREALAEGYREITLLGQNVNSYGQKPSSLAETGVSFAALLKQVDALPGIERVRFMTSHPKDLSLEVIEAIREGEHLCPHIHLPLQHGSDRILKAMNRGYTAEKYRNLASLIRERLPQVSLTTDLIVGFPGESDADFQATLDLVAEIGFDSAFTFLYSPRSGTPAAAMAAQVPEEVKKARLQALMAQQNKISLAINEKLVGSIREVLVEGASKNDATVWTGRTRHNKQVLWPHADEKPGDLISIKINKAQTWLLKGEIHGTYADDATILGG
ncbi:MAG: tRNA (N6-isopentenyl adenosine(37)-C2)-methylthiotransferase MiaB [Selenomonadaceae bacterium]|nr:tRNA (N6-isopentenyl adenosine(37)-C2)-methylthiotransferase MiaB [Selenomonadaceae bacterium]